MNYNETAVKILKAVGGDSNIQHLEHCSTRLRITLVDDKKAKINEIKSIPGVLGVNMTGQCQIIIGTSVIEVYTELRKMIKGNGNSNQSSNVKKSPKAIMIDFVVSVFQPLIPAIAGGGILKSLLMLLNMLHILNNTTDTYKVLNFIGDAPLFFLPILVAITVANKMKVNPLVAVSAVAVLITPNLATMLGGETGATLFGIQLQNIKYAYQVFPAILSVLLYSQLEKFFTKVTPKVIRIFFVPMMSLLITVPITLLLLGPLGFNFGQYFVIVIMFIFEKFGWLAIALLSAFLPFMVATGMHKAMIPYVIASLGQSGKELIYNAASLAHNISEGGAMFAVAIKAKDKTLKATATSAGISAMFGITEPALYGVTLLHRRVLYGVMIGAFVGGAYLGINGVEAYVAVGPGLASLSMFISETLPKNMLHAVIGLIISVAVSFVSVFILWKETSEESIVTFNVKEKFSAPVTGELINLTELKDNVFSSKVMGDGMAIIPSKGELYAPIDGTIEMVFETKHTIAMKTENGTEILFHVGIDTVNLKGKYFNPQVTVGKHVKKGDLLLTFELENIIKEGFNPAVVMVVTNRPESKVDILKRNAVSKLDFVCEIS